MSRSEPILSARALVKQYKRVRAVDGIDLDVGAGERVALLGPNGAGKTTTLLMLLGVITPDSGYVEIGGHRLPHKRSAGDGARRLRRRLPAAARAPPGRRVPHDVRPPLRHRRPAPADRASGSSASGSRTSPNAMGNELSSGQRTLVGIIKATLHRPRLLVLDEPTASLDPDVALRVRTGLERLVRGGRHRAARHQPRHGRGRAALRARRVRLARPGRRRRHRRGRRRPLRPRRPRGRLPPPRERTRRRRVPGQHRAGV